MSLAALRFLALILVFAATVLAIEGLVGWLQTRRDQKGAISRRLTLIAAGAEGRDGTVTLRKADRIGADLPEPLRRPVTWLDRIAASAGLQANGLQLATYMALGTVIVFGLAAFAALYFRSSISTGTLLMIGTFAGGSCLVLPLILIQRLADRRRRKVADQFPVALDIFVRGLRSGHPVATAIGIVAEEMSEPLGSEFKLVLEEVNYGADLRDALQNMAMRWKLNELDMFVTSLSIQRESGGNLAEILENLAGVIRDRASVMRSVRALSSEGRMTAAILTALPVLAFTVLFLVNPNFYLAVADDPYFTPGFVSLIGMYLVGFISIRRMINLTV
jgi:tight adherence protein B